MAVTGKADDAGEIWDAVVVGGGAAGLSLAYHLAAAGWGHRVAVVDDGARRLERLSWAWWSTGTCLLDAHATAVFPELTAAGHGWSRRAALTPYAYRSISGRALSAAVDAVFAGRQGYRRLTGRVVAVSQAADAAEVTVALASGGVERLSARWVFDSVGVGDTVPDPRAAAHLDFSGRYVECDSDAFDPGAVTLMDFRTEQADGVAFMYVLPTSPTTALVERTVFAHPEAGTGGALDHGPHLDAYFREVLEITDARVVGKEEGFIPLVTHRPSSARGVVIPIGARAGMVRASTGYAFERIQRHSERITERLVAGKYPGGAASSERWPRVLDAALLRVIREDPDAVRTAFAAMLARHPAPRTLAFLDGTAGPWDQVRIFASLPLFRFARAQMTATLARGVRQRRP